MCSLTLAGLSLGDPLPDDPAGVINGRGGLKLHRLHNVALADAYLQRQHHHLGLGVSGEVGGDGEGGDYSYTRKGTKREG